MRTIRWLAVTLVLLGIVGYAAFRLLDPEKRDLDASVRKLVTGRFAHLSDGFTHYELAGPPNGDVVVLAAGATVPYYIWYPTFKFLADSGFRVLRYDYFGRGYSDRPDIAYNEDLYVRQLAELLDSLKITAPINLAGLSFGGSVITAFTDRYPARVKRLIYFDPLIRRKTPPRLALRIPVVRNIAALLDERASAESQLADFLHPARFPDWPVRYRPQLQYHGFRRARLADQLDRANLDQQPELDRLSKQDRPVFIAWGKQDSTIPITASKQLLAAFPKSVYVVVDSARHLPHWEDPRGVHPALLEFLRRH
ncbi:MAG: alpha/beta hydrolase [Gemmatimonadota bacterium]